MNDEALSAEDRLKILELLARADDAASKRDIETYITLFTDDADLQGIKGVHRGKDALRAGDPAFGQPRALPVVTLRSTASCIPMQEPAM